MTGLRMIGVGLGTSCAGLDGDSGMVTSGVLTSGGVAASSAAFAVCGLVAGAALGALTGSFGAAVGVGQVMFATVKLHVCVCVPAVDG